MEQVECIGGVTMVVHGPEAFDHGDAAWLSGLLRPTTIIVAGVMARTAAEESGLPVVFSGEPPSRVLSRLETRAFLLNRGKTPASGLVFGEIVAGRIAPEKGLVQVECSSGTVYLWNGADETLGHRLAELTGFLLERRSASPVGVPGRREIRGCLPGEAVCVNGLVIGYAEGETVVLEERNGHVVPVHGLRLKPHGLEKLHQRGNCELRSAWCKSGPVRMSRARGCRQAPDHGRILVLDHCGHELYERLESGGICGVLSIGDDTTAICGHICLHLGIPVLGIVDGDADGLVQADFAPGSLVFEIREGRDDEAGRELASRVPSHEVSWSAWCEEALEILVPKGRVLLRVPCGGREKEARRSTPG